MRLVKQTKDGWQYRLNQPEANCLRSLLQQFPITANTHSKISRTDADPKTVEREKLLNESLAEHRNELKKQATNLLAPGKFKRGEIGYTQLHRRGRAHSIECWRNGELAGGIYGVSLGGLFAGESMFHRADNASKVAINFLVEHLRQRRFLLFDIQMVTAATRLLGAKAIPRSEYLKRLAVAVTKDCPFS